MNGGRTLAYAKICLRTHGLVSPLMPLFDKFSDNISTCKSKRALVKKQSLCQQQNKAIPKSHKRDVGMALLKVMDGSASAETHRYLYDPLPVEKFK